MKTALLALLIAACPALAHAQMVVLGEGAPQSCYNSAKVGNMGSLSAIRNCTDALGGLLVPQDEAATYVNRGVLQMRRGDYDKAVMDYQRALKIRPDLPEAYINYGAALFYQGEDAQALEAYNTALSLETDKKADALFNRALVYERMENPKEAYYDLKAALALRPDWEQAQESIKRFTVTRQHS